MDNNHRRPKGILRDSKSAGSEGKTMHWDEQNIIETYHPENKDYGHMKIDEPKTPYNEYNSEEDSGNEAVQFDGKFTQDDINSKFSNVEFDYRPTVVVDNQRRASFQEKRKHHYNEFKVMQGRRQIKLDKLKELNKEYENGNEKDTEPGPVSRERCDSD